MKFLEFLRKAYSDGDSPSSSRLHTGYATYAFVSAITFGFVKVCFSHSELILGYLITIAALTAGVLGIQVAKNALSENKPDVSTEQKS